ncbi:MAG: hypothetical protein ACKPKO_31315, partial [Candidatus Fonsibacter sp.]
PVFFASFALLLYATDSYYSDNSSTTTESSTTGVTDTNVYQIDSMSISDETVEKKLNVNKNK